MDKSPCLQKDTWLSSQIGRPCFTIKGINESSSELAELGAEFSALVQKHSQEGIFAYTKIPTKKTYHIAPLQEMGFILVDTNVQFKRELGNTLNEGIEYSAFKVRWAKDADRAVLNEIAEKSFAFSRFHLDPTISNQTANNIKRSWVNNFFKGERGDRMVVGEIDGKPAGFIQILEREDHFIIDLIAVDNRYQKRGVAGRMMEFSFKHYKDLAYCLVGTQISNIPSINLYLKYGFKFHNSKYVFHFNR